MKKGIYLFLVLILGLSVGSYATYKYLHKNNEESKFVSSEKTSDTKTGNDNTENNKSESSNTENKVEDKKEKEESNTTNNEIKEVDGVKYSKKVVLDVKQQTQKVWNYCAPTTVSMMLSMRGIDVDQYTLAKDMGTYEPFGTHNKDAIRVLNKYMFGYEYPKSNQAGYRLETVTTVNENTLNTFKERLKDNIKNGYPMYYTFDVSKVYNGLRGEHNVIGIGYALTPDEKDIALVYYIDPDAKLKDATYGGLKVITPEKLLTAMLTCEEPNYAW